MSRGEIRLKYNPILAEDIVLKNLPKGLKRVLDFGCGSGSFTNELVSRVAKVYACDVDRDVINENKHREDKIIYQLIKINSKISYPDNFFDCVTLMGVLEHVPNESQVLEEIYRILKPKGILFIYVLNTGLFGFLDSANLKFAVPKLHKYLYYLFYSKKAYKKEFLQKRIFGMRGDFSEGKNWHTHYSLTVLKKLSEGKFEIQNVWYYSFFLPILLIIDFVFVKIFGRISGFISWLVTIDNRISLGRFSYCIVVKFRKI